MRKQLTETIYKRDDLLEIIDNVEKTINKTVLPYLKELQSDTDGKKELSENVVFMSLKLKDDKELFRRLENVVIKYSKTIPILRSKLEEEISDTLQTSSANINIRLVFSLVSQGIFLSVELISILNYTINRYYTKSESELESGTKTMLGNKLMTLIKMLPELEKADFNKIVEVVGNIPTLKTLRHEESSVIPVDLVIGFLSDNFKIKEFYTQSLIRKFIEFVGFKKGYGIDKDITKQFIGNPIYHIRLFLVDLEYLRLTKLKDEARLLELRLMELKNQNMNKPSKEVAKAIRYYEDKINKLNLKIEKLSEVK